jgi:hypothetical protein
VGILQRIVPSTLAATMAATVPSRRRALPTATLSAAALTTAAESAAAAHDADGLV